ncbi:MAG TPA: MBL fold metallo-hydrolase [Dehalococcoidia bacterium]|nr:MBL fold metallo-hydrolase [Dehalococcoidia bacterium]
MEIVWLGHSCFRIRGREATILTDPCPPSSGYNVGKPTADIVTISHSHENHTYVKAVAGSPRIVDGPGEYEMHGAFLTGITTYHDTEKGAARGRNLCFIMEMEDIKVCHLGDLGHTPTAEQAEEMTGADVLLVPIGGVSTIDGARAAEIVSLLEARLVIPMHYKTEALKEQLDAPDRFLKEMGVTNVEPLPKLTITRSSLPSDTQVMMLDYRG